VTTSISLGRIFGIQVGINWSWLIVAERRPLPEVGSASGPRFSAGKNGSSGAPTHESNLRTRFRKPLVERVEPA
jgi:hypothetical protein